uniref:Uncharacterized protein n=1 Tax=viral metagenome TaxID=1070528 RepID=A0A6C0ITD9_9ZZZZ
MSNCFKNSSRFAILLDDIEPVNNKPTNKEQTNNNNTQATKENNIFKRESITNSSNNNHFRRSNNNRLSNYYNSNNNPSKPRTLLPAIVNRDFNSETHMFPDLLAEKTNNTNGTNGTNSINDISEFKNTLLKQIDVPVNQEIKKTFVKKGWLEIKGNTNNVGKIDYTYGSENQYLDYEDELRDFYDNNMNLFVSREIDKMKLRWDKYKYDYNEIYGEGAYEELYYSSPVYGSEYDSNSDTIPEDGDDCDDNDYYD